jgi:hypothetical protein
MDPAACLNNDLNSSKIRKIQDSNRTSWTEYKEEVAEVMIERPCDSLIPHPRSPAFCHNKETNIELEKNEHQENV